MSHTLTAIAIIGALLLPILLGLGVRFGRRQARAASTPPGRLMIDGEFYGFDRFENCI